MPWFNADDKMRGHPKVRVAGLEAIGLWVVCGTYSSSIGTPGYITRQDVRIFTSKRKPITQLIKSGLWEALNDGYAFHGDGEFWRVVDKTREPIPLSLRLAIYARDGWACLACQTTKDLTLDHIWPWSKGGADSEDNLQTLCRSCNSRKGARTT